VMDGRSFARLSGQERNLLDAAIRQGLGLLLFDAEPAEERGLGISSRALGNAAERDVQIRWPGQTPLPTLTVPNREIAARSGAVPWIYDGEGRTLAARERRDHGWIGLSLLTGTYHLALVGPRRDFAALWARLMGGVARAESGARFIEPVGPVIVDRPLDLTLWSPSPTPPRILAGDAVERYDLPVDRVGGGWFASRFWPRHAGWIRLLSSNGAATWIYASSAERWRTWRQARRIAATREREAIPQPATEGLPARVGPWPRWPFYALFLAGVGLLWLRERIGTVD
jgi:hypothetical protein